MVIGVDARAKSLQHSMIEIGGHGLAGTGVANSERSSIGRLTRLPDADNDARDRRFLHAVWNNLIQLNDPVDRLSRRVGGARQSCCQNGQRGDSPPRRQSCYPGHKFPQSASPLRTYDKSVRLDAYVAQFGPNSVIDLLCRP
jgi:hypothetical protein